jgi:hypothetical protein
MPKKGLGMISVGTKDARVRKAPCPVLTLREATRQDKAALTFTVESAAWRSALGHSGTSRE